MAETGDTKTYRGRTLEEVIPQIKAELGPDAVVLRQRDGLTGGVGGFFQKQCIEVEARPAEARRFDAYDEAPGAEPVAEEVEWEPLPPRDAATEEGLASRAIQAMIEQAAPFADHLTLAEQAHDEIEQPPVAPARAPEPPATPATPGPPVPAGGAPEPPARAGERPPLADTLESTLTGAGIAPELAATIVGETVSHLLPFASPRSLKRLVRGALARQVPTQPGATGRGRTLAFVGPGGSGKTLCVARLAAGYASAGTLPVVCLTLRPADSGAELAELLSPAGVTVRPVASAEQAHAHVVAAGGEALVVLDTPSALPKSDAQVAELAAELSQAGLDEIHLALPATFSGPAAEELAVRLMPLGATRIALTHTDESSHVGGIVDMVIRSRTPISFLSGGTEVGSGLEPADPAAIAALVLP